MDDRITDFADGVDEDEGRDGGPRTMRDVLDELLARYQALFPNLNITVVKLPAA